MKIIGKGLTIVGVIALLLGFNSMVFSADMVLWGNYQKAPKIFLDDNKQARGVLIEIADLIASRTGHHFIYNLAPWARAYYQSQKAKQQNTGIIGIKKNAERLKLFDFSEPIYLDSNYLVVLKQRNLKIDKIEDLKGLRVGYNRNGYFGPKFEQAKQYFIDAADTNNNLRLKKLLLGRIDAALIGGPGRLGLKMALKQDKALQGKEDKFILLPLTFENPDHIAFAKNLNQTKSLDSINQAIKELTAENVINRIIEKYDQ